MTTVLIIIRRWVDRRGCRVSISAIKIGGRMYPVGL
jgi:hypothetical protein